MSHLARAAGLTGFVEVALSVGIDPYRVAADAGVPAAALSDPDMKVASRAEKDPLVRRTSSSVKPRMNSIHNPTRPPIVFCDSGRARVVVRRETYSDLMSRDVS